MVGVGLRKCRPEERLRVANLGSRLWIGRGVRHYVVGRASRKQSTLIGKVPVNGEPLHARPLGYSADGGLGGAQGLVQLHGRLGDLQLLGELFDTLW
jgi:hypothetical protein